MRLPIIIVTLLVAGLPAFAQPYARPQPINAGNEVFLLDKLKTATGSERAWALTALANLYVSKGIKSSADIRQADAYVRLAEETSLSFHQQALYKESQLLKCQLAVELGKSALAEQIPPGTDDTAKAIIYSAYAYFYMNTSGGDATANIQRSREYLGKASRLIDSIRLPRLYRILKEEYGELLITDGKYDAAEPILNKLIEGSRLSGDRQLHYVLLDLGMLYFYQGKYDKALSAVLKALQSVKATNDSLAFADAYMFLGMIFRNTGQLDKALDNFNQSFENYKLYTGFIFKYSNVIHQIGGVMVGRHEYRQALQYYVSQYEKYPPLVSDDKRVALGDIADCYLKLKQYDLAERYFLQEFKIAKEAGALEERAFHRLAFFYVEAGRYRQALRFLDSAIRRLGTTTAVQVQGHLFYMHYLADSAIGNYLSAMKYLRANKRVDDTLMDRSRQAEIQRLTVQYETDAKSRQIGLLEKSNELYLANQRNAVLIRDISIGAIAVVGAVAFGFYRQYRNKKRLAATINDKNRQLEVLLDEKEYLLKEVHHRVKNNLHTVISLLDIQAEYLKDDALKALENSQHRIYAMSLIHQQLYAGETLTAINLGVYIGALIVYLRESLGAVDGPRFEVDIEPVDVDVSIAIPLGLIINEAVTNAVKYAFPERSDANTIGVEIRRSGNEILVHIWDNGIGLSNDGTSRPESLGFKLIKGLCKEIDANLTFENRKGVHIRIRTPMGNPFN